MNAPTTAPLPAPAERSPLDVLLGLDRVRLGDPNAALEFAFALPGWAWVGAAVAAGGLAWAGYAGLIGPRSWRAVLAGVRAALILLVLLLLTGPALVVRETSIEPDSVLVLADRSLSMTMPDGASTRDAALRELVVNGAGAWNEAAQTRDIRWLGFAAGVFDLDAPAPSEVSASTWAIPAPEGTSTAIHAALGEAMRRAGGRPVAGIVVISDGQSSDTLEAATLRRLTGARVPVYVVLLGETDGPGDARIASVDAPSSGWAGDPAALSVRIEASESASLSGTLRLIDETTGAVLDEQRVDTAESPSNADGAERATVAERTLLARVPDEAGAGAGAWRVEFVPDLPDAIEANNTRTLTIRRVDEPLRVLYIDGYPRWEQRYLKSLLLREPTIVSANLLLGPGRRYLQEGDETVATLPETPEEWAAWDVVVLGDVRPELFGQTQLAALRTHVSERGGGLLWIAGPSATPGAWSATPLSDLLPIDASDSGPGVWDRPVVLEPSDEARRLGVLRLGDDGRSWPDALRAHETGWSRLRWAQRIEPEAMKPASEVLARAVDDRGAASPALIHMRFGSGRVLYVATDETWRWRYGRGEDLQERFWLPLVRLLARDATAGDAPAPVTLRTAPAEPAVQERVTITVDVRDQSLLGVLGDRIEATISDPEGRSRELSLRTGEGSSLRRRYSGAWVPPDAGTYTLRISEPLLAGMGLDRELVVRRGDEELLHPRPDHGLLERLAESTGGEVVPPGDFASIPARLGDRRIVSEGVRARETLWDSPLSLILIALLLAGEWVGRRLIRLV
ncbi:MAG: hypothetical protein AAF356_05800 [Planctomycetota bacterium]